VGGWERMLTDLVVGRGVSLKRYAYLLCGDEAEADDLVQDALLRTFTYPRRGDIDDLERYVRKVIFNRHVDQVRRRKVWARLKPLLGTPVLVAEDLSVVTRADVRTALLSLSPRQRACLILRYYVDLPLAAIAEILECSSGAVKRHLHDGRSRLQDAMDVT